MKSGDKLNRTTDSPTPWREDQITKESERFGAYIISYYLQYINRILYVAGGEGGRGDYKHIDRDFHALHVKGEQLERAIETPADVGGLLDQGGEMTGTDASAAGQEFVTISRNACGIEQEAVHDTIHHLSDERWDEILLQEGQGFEQEAYKIIDGGH